MLGAVTEKILLQLLYAIFKWEGVRDGKKTTYGYWRNDLYFLSEQN